MRIGFLEIRQRSPFHQLYAPTRIPSLRSRASRSLPIGEAEDLDHLRAVLDREAQSQRRPILVVVDVPPDAVHEHVLPADAERLELALGVPELGVGEYLNLHLAAGLLGHQFGELHGAHMDGAVGRLQVTELHDDLFGGLRLGADLRVHAHPGPQGEPQAERDGKTYYFFA